jgi:hypothetical protein
MWFVLSYALAATLTLEIRTGEPNDTVYGQWTDSAGVQQVVDATLPTGLLRDAPSYPGSIEARTQEQFVRLQAWSAEHAPKLTITLDSVIHYRGTTSDIAKAKAASASIRAEVLQEFRLRDSSETKVQHDVVRIALESVDAVRPVSRGLGAMLDARTLADRAMSMTQQLPYRGSKEHTFRSPLASIRDSAGDCDEKVALFVALMRAQEPTLPMAVVVMEGHAFVAIDVHAHPGDQTVTVLGQTLVAAEPVGPLKAPIGRLGPRSKTALESGAYEAFQVPTL